MKLLLKVFPKFLFCTLLAIFGSIGAMRRGMSEKVEVYILGLLLLANLFILYMDIIRPICKLNKAMSIIDFNLNTIDFTKLDRYEYKHKDNFKVLVDKIKDLSDVLIARVDKVNVETYKSEHDGLSGLYNRLRYQNYKSTYETCKEVCVIYIDVNNLKKTNDIYGHDAGDALIERASRRLSFFSNIGDCYRMGGDEFMVVITNKSEEDCNKLIDEWYPTVGCLNNPDEGFKCMMAYGVVHASGDFDIDELVKEADEKMYHHKVEIKIANGEDPNSR